MSPWKDKTQAEKTAAMWAAVLSTEEAIHGQMTHDDRTALLEDIAKGTGRRTGTDVVTALVDYLKALEAQG